MNDQELKCGLRSIHNFQIDFMSDEQNTAENKLKKLQTGSRFPWDTGYEENDCRINTFRKIIRMAAQKSHWLE